MVHCWWRSRVLLTDVVHERFLFLRFVCSLRFSRSSVDHPPFPQSSYFTPLGWNERKHCARAKIVQKNRARKMLGMSENSEHIFIWFHFTRSFFTEPEDLVALQSSIAFRGANSTTYHVHTAGELTFASTLYGALSRRDEIMCTGGKCAK